MRLAGPKTLNELIALIRATPGGMLFAASNRGGQSHLTGELFRLRTGLNLTFVHATGAASSLNDVTTGRIPIMFEGIAGIGGAIQGGTLTPLAIASDKLGSARGPIYSDGLGNDPQFRLQGEATP